MCLFYPLFFLSLFKFFSFGSKVCPSFVLPVHRFDAVNVVGPVRAVPLLPTDDINPLSINPRVVDMSYESETTWNTLYGQFCVLGDNSTVNL